MEKHLQKNKFIYIKNDSSCHICNPFSQGMFDELINNSQGVDINFRVFVST